MEYKRVFKHDDFHITTFMLTYGKAYYIHAEPSQYLHKDGTVYDHCGEENMFNSIKEAQELIDKYFKLPPIDYSLPKSLFEIEI